MRSSSAEAKGWFFGALEPSIRSFFLVPAIVFPCVLNVVAKDRSPPKSFQSLAKWPARSPAAGASKKKNAPSG